MSTLHEDIVDGKVILTTEHEDGRKDVNIEVQTLDVDLSDPANAAAKKVIEEQVLPALANKKVTCTIIHKFTTDHASFVCARKDVLKNAELFIANHATYDKSEYCLVQNDGDNITVTTL